MIIWSDDCLSCLCNLPHSMEKHMQAVNAAISESRQHREDLRAANSDWFEDETDNAGEEHKAISPVALASLIKALETSLHGF
jgi:hypothetical protein